MTISTTVIKNSYSGTGSQDVFAYTFKIAADSDMEVIIRASTGTETVKTITTHYTVSGAGTANGGNVTFTSGNIPTNTETVVLRRKTTKTQGLDLVENDPFTAESIEGAFDKNLSIIQELQEEVDRSIKLSRTNTINSTEFTNSATDRASKILAFDTNGELSVASELGSYKGNWSSGTAFGSRDIVKDTSNNNIYICNTAHTSSGSQPISSNTDVAKWDLLVDASSATTSQTAAASSATAAASSATASANSATAAATSESNANTHKTAAETAKTAAETAKTAAETAQAAAETALDTFDDRFLGAKSSNPTVDNDGNTLVDGALYFDTTNNLMKVYDLGNTTWHQLALTGTNQTNVNTVAGQISPTNNIATVAGANSNIGTVAGQISPTNNIGTLAGISGLSSLAAAHAAVTNVNNNLAAVQNFADVYRIASSAPSSSLNVGDLYFDTTANELKVYKSSGWAAAGSTVNGTSQRYTYNISGTPNSVTGSDANGNTLAYDAGYADVYLNGVRLSGADITITSGTSVVFASNLANGDVVDIVAYGTFDVASINAGNIDTGTLNNARLTGSGAITINGSAVALGGSVTVGETKPTISSLTPTVITNDPSNVVIAGANFVAIPRVHAINTSTGIWYEASSVTYTSASSITANFTLTVDSANYRIRVENPDGNAVISGASALNVSDAPAWTTSAGSLGSVAGDFSGTVATVAATGDTVTFTEVSSPLVLTNNSQANCSLASNGVISTSDFGGSSTTATLYTFTIRATDAQGQTSDRVFTLQSSFGATGGGQFN